MKKVLSVLILLTTFVCAAAGDIQSKIAGIDDLLNEYYKAVEKSVSSGKDMQTVFAEDPYFMQTEFNIQDMQRDLKKEIRKSRQFLTDEEKVYTAGLEDLLPLIVFRRDALKRLRSYQDAALKLRPSWLSAGITKDIELQEELKLAAEDAISGYNDMLQSVIQKMRASKVTEIGLENFDEEVIKSRLPVVVDFYAPWCGPCKKMSPTVEELAKENEGKVKFVKVDVGSFDKTDKCSLHARYDVNLIPTFLFFKNGKLVKTQVGSLLKNELQKMIEDNLFN